MTGKDHGELQSHPSIFMETLSCKEWNTCPLSYSREIKVTKEKDFENPSRLESAFSSLFSRLLKRPKRKERELTFLLLWTSLTLFYYLSSETL